MQQKDFLFPDRIFEFLRGHSRVFFVKSEKVRVVSEARREARLRDGIAAADEVVDEMDAAKGEIIVYSDSHLLTEEMADVIFAMEKFIRDVGERNILGVMSVQVLKYLKYELVFDARGLVGRLLSVNSFAYSGKKLDDLTAQKYRIGTSVARGVGEYLSHKPLSAYLTQSVGSENITDSARSFVKCVKEPRALYAKAVRNAFADVERDALERFVVGYGAAMQLGGVEDYHISRAECVESALDSYFTVSSQKKEQDKRGVVVKLRHQRVILRISDGMVHAAAGVVVVAYSR